MSIDAMKQALVALEQYTNVVTSTHDPNSWVTVADGGKPARDAINALRTAITDYAQTSFDVCSQCGWRTQRPGFECLNCLNADLQAKLNKYMAQEAARESKK
jgi:hypothetical protein